jgi:hypothetical protein
MAPAFFLRTAKPTPGIILPVLSLSVGIPFGKSIRDNSDDASILGCELPTETGPDFTKPINGNDFEAILPGYAK